jgi:hypothetical protein
LVLDLVDGLHLPIGNVDCRRSRLGVVGDFLEIAILVRPDDRPVIVIVKAPRFVIADFDDLDAIALETTRTRWRSRESWIALTVIEPFRRRQESLSLILSASAAARARSASDNGKACAALSAAAARS